MDKNKVPFLTHDHLWEKSENPILIASTLTLNRNLEKFKFPGKLNEEQRKQIIGLVSAPLLNNPLLDEPVLVSAEEITPLEKEFLYEHYLTRRSFHEAQGGEAFVIDSKGSFLIALNLRDHLQFEVIESQGDIENAWNRLVKIETHLNQTISYAFLPKFGFLTADPAEAGTGLSVALFLQATAMIHMGKLNEFLERYQDDSISVSGLHGKPGDIIGDLLTIRNNHTLGLSEENILTTVRSFATKLHVQEKSARSELKQNANAHIKDMVGRAYGLLAHSYQVETIEALNAISLLKLGLDLGWVTGITMSALNSLFFQSRRAHLQFQMGDFSRQELPHKRAEFIHQMLRNAQVNVDV